MRIIVLFAFLAAGFFAGCSNPISSSDEPVTGAKVLVVQIAGESPAGRTALPPDPAPAKYTIDVSRGGDRLGGNTFAAGSGSYPIELNDDPKKDDVVTVAGLNDSEVEIARGSHILTESDMSGNAVSITLSPLTEGTGDVNLSVNFDRVSEDGEITVAEVSLYKDLDDYKAKRVFIDDGTTYSTRYRKNDGSHGTGMDFSGANPKGIIPIEYDDLPWGNYVLMIEFFRDDLNSPTRVSKVSRLVQTIIVRGNLTTNKWDNGTDTLAWNAFASSNANLAEAGGIKIENTAITGYDKNTTDYNIYMLTPSLPTSRALAVTGGEPGQAIEVTLNASTTPVSLNSGASYTFEQLATDGAVSLGYKNTLKIKVTAPDGFTEKTYTVNISGKEIIDFYFEVNSKKYGVGSGVENDSGSISGGNNIAVTVPYGTSLATLTPTVVHSGTSIDLVSGTAWGSVSPKTYKVTAADGSTTDYSVTVNVAKIKPLPAIEVTGNLLSPHGFAKTDLNISGSIKAAITVTGTDSLGTAITLDAADYSVDALTPSSAGENAIATLRVSGSNTSTGSDITKPFEVYIKNDAKAITEFYFIIGGKKYGAGTGAVTGSGEIIDEPAKTVKVTVPYGTVIAGLPAPTVTVSSKASSSPASGVSSDFTNPVSYTVTAEDETTTATYSVTVNVAKIASITEVKGNFLSPGFKKTGSDISGSIKTAIASVTGTDSLGTVITLAAADYSVDAFTPSVAGTTVNATLRVPTGKTSTGSELPTNFTVYIKNDAKAITEFYFIIGGKKYGVGNEAVVDSGKIEETAKTVEVTVPYGSGTVIAGLPTPTVTVSPKASSSTASEASGLPPDFTSPVTYKVTAEDGTTADYTVTVQERPGLTIDTITVETLGNFTFSLYPVTPESDGSITVEPSTEITITLKDTNDASVTPNSWCIAISGPDTITPTDNKFTPTVRGFYNVNVFATIDGIPYSGSFGLTVK